MYRNNRIVAIIPARSGSKGIKNKNLIKLLGNPLINYSINYAKKSKLIDRIFVSTDGENISKISKNFGAEIIKRPKKYSSDTASSDSAVIHAIKYIKQRLGYEFDIVVFLQPTTVLRKFGELDQAIQMLVKKKLDTVFSSVDYQPFLWTRSKNNLRPENFNPKKRKRRQDISIINETGSYYITKKDAFLKSKNRFGKKILNFQSERHSILEIDQMSDLKYLIDLIKTNIPKKYKLCIPSKN